MNNKTKNIVVTSVFTLFIAFFVVMFGVKYLNPTESSDAERRPLAQFPEKITWEGVVDKSVIDEFEDYSIDQFPFREFFRGIKANFQLNVLGLKENNGLAVKDGYIVKIEKDFNEDNVDYSISRLQRIYDKYIKDNGGRHFISLIPDKNYFLGKDYGYPAPDYEWLADRVTEALDGVEYVDIYGELELEDYYKTDTHWSQDKIGAVLDKLATEMGFSDRLSGEYTENRLEGFEGVYYGQSALKPTPDTITYLTNTVLDDLTVYDYESNKTYGIYDFSKLGSKDEYEFFLSGTRALLRIDNPNATTDKELIIFRDSYGSSISPLIAQGYKSVYVIDIRYVMIDVVPMFVDFEGKDVLFLYSALVLNSRSLK